MNKVVVGLSPVAVTLSHEFVFVFISYFIGAILLKEYRQMWWVWKKDIKGDKHIRGYLKKQGSNLQDTIGSIVVKSQFLSFMN